MEEKKMDTAPQLSLDTQEVPTLTLDLETAVEQPLAPKPEQPQAAVFDESSLSDAERKMVNDFAEKIQISNSNLVLQYGSGAQKKIADFSETALNNVRTKDMSEVGEMLTNVVVELKKFNVDEEEKGLFSFFKRSGNKISTYKAKYSSAEANVNRICNVLEDHQVQLMKDIAMLDKMYELNKVYFKELSMYILAGKKKLAEVESTELPAAQEKARRTGLPEDAQAANDLSAMCNRFEKKLHDLELTRTISIQMAPQIRLIQNNDTLMTEKIQSTLVNTIPLWKSQMVLALGVAHSQQAADAQKAVTDMTNELLRKNAETLKMSSIETAKQSERGIVDIETLKATNESLISTLDEVMRIQQEGRQKRQEAETELRRIENDLKNKLLEMR
ncbi:MAG: toxic anion resistance protein [Oscillospiraceae bacterium]|nr:toxic anion resistance protein [Oscillospiraceae bacterium]MDD7041357.1 toxic anion resistance protein [Oscillospiraceae bacterium]MDY2611896.1 toxic anion resistance protein [Oscillospiraceae bacterium]